MKDRKSKRINAEVVLSCVFIILGIIIMKVSYGYGLWKGISPSKGFMPFISAALMTACSVWWLINALLNKDGKSISFSLNEVKWMIVLPAICFITVFAMKWIGLYAALGILLFGWFLVIDKYSLVKSILLSVLLCVVFYLIFSLGLQVPVPKFSLF